MEESAGAGSPCKKIVVKTDSSPAIIQSAVPNAQVGCCRGRSSMLAAGSWQLAGMLEVSLLCIVEYGGVRVISTRSGGQEFTGHRQPAGKLAACGETTV